MQKDYVIKLFFQGSEGEGNFGSYLTWREDRQVYSQEDEGRKISLI